MGQFASASGPVAVDGAHDEVYFASSSSTIKVYVRSTFDFERNLTLSGASGTPVRLVRFGANGLALLTANGLAVSVSGAGL